MHCIPYRVRNHSTQSGQSVRKGSKRETSRIPPAAAAPQHYLCITYCRIWFCLFIKLVHRHESVCTANFTKNDDGCYHFHFKPGITEKLFYAKTWASHLHNQLEVKAKLLLQTISSINEWKVMIFTIIFSRRRRDCFVRGFYFKAISIKADILWVNKFHWNQDCLPKTFLENFLSPSYLCIRLALQTQVPYQGSCGWACL